MAVTITARQVLYGESFRSTAYLAIIQRDDSEAGDHLEYSKLEIIAMVDLEAEKVDYDRITIDESDHFVALCCYRYVPFDDTPNGQRSKVFRAIHIEIFPNHAVETIHIDASAEQKHQEASRDYFELRKDTEGS